MCILHKNIATCINCCRSVIMVSNVKNQTDSHFKKKIISNIYPFYYVLFLSAQLVVYTLRECRKEKSSRVFCSYREDFYLIVDLYCSTTIDLKVKTC